MSDDAICWAGNLMSGWRKRGNGAFLGRRGGARNSQRQTAKSEARERGKRSSLESQTPFAFRTTNKKIDKCPDREEGRQARQARKRGGEERRRSQLCIPLNWQKGLADAGAARKLSTGYLATLVIIEDFQCLCWL